MGTPFPVYGGLIPGIIVSNACLFTLQAIMKALEDARKQDPNVKVAEVTITKQETEDDEWGRRENLFQNSLVL